MSLDSLDTDQARHLVGPDLCPNCLQRLSAEEKVATSMENDEYVSLAKSLP